MLREIKPPYESNEKDKLNVFLAGTIDMGNSKDWQTTFCEKLEEISNSDVVVFNPRRDNWDPKWEQTIDNEDFNRQVIWELNHLEESDVIVFHFEPESTSIITMLELGIFSQRHKCILVHCPDGYFRKGNVDIICNHFNIQQFSSMDDIMSIVKFLALEKFKNGKVF